MVAEVQDRDRINGPITEDWLRAVGFKWHDVRETDKHWLLWLGDAMGLDYGSEGFGIELAPRAWCATHKAHDSWNCWLRADTAGRYSRFIHVRHLHSVRELLTMIEGLTGQVWDPDCNWWGSMRTPEGAERCHRAAQRMDRTNVCLRAQGLPLWSIRSINPGKSRTL